MADEEGEVRRMAEIADAINAILEAEPSVGDTPTSAPQNKPPPCYSSKPNFAVTLGHDRVGYKRQ